MSTLSTSEPFFSYWGKAKPRDNTGARYHLLPYHCLDVAAIARAYLLKQPRLLSFFAESLHLPNDTMLPVLTWLVALHDVGKFSEAFQGQKKELFEKLQKRLPGYDYVEYHDTLGDRLWNRELAPKLFKEDFCQPSMRWKEGMSALIAAVTGHHGQPPKTGDTALHKHFSQSDQTTALAFARAMRDLLVPASDITKWFAQEPNRFNQVAPLISWWVAGVTVLADWIGSNQAWFHYCDDDKRGIEEYWGHAQAQAEIALTHTGVLPQRSAQGRTLTDLFPKLEGKKLTPLQQRAASLPLAEGPQLYLLEDLTGAGKTEAAVMLAHRLMAEQGAPGLFIGMPTMATTEAMFERLQETAKKLYSEDARPSFVLAMGQSHLSAAFQASILPPDQAEHDSEQSKDETASARCAAWIADNSKKALLANVGAGTVDQAMLAALHSRHQSLRLLGLFGKVLLVDEVHACDAYMQAVLETLLTFHAAAGGSAILISATLPSDMKQKLVAAFCQGAGIEPPVLTSRAYPLLTGIPTKEEPETAVASRKEARRKVIVDYEHDEARVLHGIRDALSAGRCVCWVRNTVADAMAAHAKFADLPEDRRLLFHARFCYGDRRRIETQVKARFGEDSTPEQRAGTLVIATQVIEQSLDVDFDLVVSDLAPIDRLIQRAGRMMRHTRDANGARAVGKDGRGAPRMAVYGPAWTGEPEENWFQSVFRKAAAVYPHHGQLWLTARQLQSGAFRMPEHARKLIKGVYDERANQQIPKGLRNKCNKAEGDEDAHRCLGKQNSLKFQLGYRKAEGTWWDDASMPTRLGEESLEVRLLRWENGTLQAWFPAKEHALDYSTVRVLAKYIARDAEPDGVQARKALEAFKARLPDQGRWNGWLVLTPDGKGGGFGSATNRDGQRLRWRYDAQFGLRRVGGGDDEDE